jgi:hypothetical protein
MERGPHRHVSTIEELFERKSSGSGLETEITGVGIYRADNATPLYPQKLALTSTTGGGHWRTKAMDFVISYKMEWGVG